MPSESRLRWQCRRGMRELDILLTGYLEHRYTTASEAEKSAFRELLQLSDPELAGYLLRGERSQDELRRQLVDAILSRDPAE